MRQIPLYGKTALKAVEIIKNNKTTVPRSAWNEAVLVYTESKSSREKACPRTTFLGLCAHSLIEGIPTGRSQGIKATPNIKHTLEAIKCLKDQPELPASNLWALTCKNLSLKKKAHNGQMDVVIALHKANALILN